MSETTIIRNWKGEIRSEGSELTWKQTAFCRLLSVEYHSADARDTIIRNWKGEFRSEGSEWTWNRPRSVGSSTGPWTGLGGLDSNCSNSLSTSCLLHTVFVLRIKTCHRRFSTKDGEVDWNWRAALRNVRFWSSHSWNRWWLDLIQSVWMSVFIWEITHCGRKFGPTNQTPFLFFHEIVSRMRLEQKELPDQNLQKFRVWFRWHRLSILLIILHGSICLLSRPQHHLDPMELL